MNEVPPSGGAPGHRAGRMWERVAADLASVGLSALEGGRVLDALEAALAHRVGALGDPRDPRLLHPARTLLILVQDAGCRDPRPLVAAPLLESRFPRLAVPPASLSPGVREAAGPLLSRIPAPYWGGPPGVEEGASGEAGAPATEEADARVLEALVSLPPAGLDLALSEALDHLRHLHLEDDRAALERGVELARRVYLPLARRSRGVLARRYEWWERIFSGILEARRTEG